MKTHTHFLMMVLLALTSLRSWSNGMVNFSNRAFGVEARIFDVDGTTPLSGGAFKAQLYTGVNSNSLVAVGTPVSFRTGAAAGYFLGGAVSTSLPDSQSGVAQVVAWDASGGATNYESATIRGASLVFSITPGNPNSDPPGCPSNLTGLESFMLEVSGGEGLTALLTRPAPSEAATEEQGAGAASVSLSCGPGDLCIEMLGVDETGAYLRLHGTVSGTRYVLLGSTDINRPVVSWTFLASQVATSAQIDFAPVAVGSNAQMFFVGTTGLQVNSDATATSLAECIMGPGIQISDASLVDTAPASRGFFSGGQNCGLPIDAGVILSTGRIVDAVGPQSGSGNHLWQVMNTPGDTSLDLLVAQFGTTLDAAVLTFKFVSPSDHVAFDYIFASEEYPEWLSSYNDPMAIYIDGNQIAQVPGTTRYVSPTTVSGGGFNLHTGLPAPPEHPEFYMDNGDPDLEHQCDIQYRNTPDRVIYLVEFDGLTIERSTGLPLHAEGQITPNVWHTVKIAIADCTAHGSAPDMMYDSAVFIRGTCP